MNNWKFCCFHDKHATFCFSLVVYLDGLSESTGEPLLWISDMLFYEPYQLVSNVIVVALWWQSHQLWFKMNQNKQGRLWVISHHDTYSIILPMGGLLYLSEELA